MASERPARRGDERRPAERAAAEAPHEAMLRHVESKGERRERARREGRHGLGYGLGMFGLVGWSVAVPTLLGIALGVWIDRTTASPYSWTLMLMLIGLVIGCFNAWYWLRKEGGWDDRDA
jgi:ATP synthase protein I